MSRRGGQELVGGGDDKRGGSGQREARSLRGGCWSSGSGSPTPLLKKVRNSTGLPSLLPILTSKSSRSSDLIIPPHACMETPICHLPSISATSVPRSPPPPSGPLWSPPHYDEHLDLALSADALAGGPYENFLRVSGRGVMLHHLGLWQELDGFLHLLLNLGEGPSKALRQVLAGKIMAVYLTDAWQCVSRPEGERHTTHLTKSTISQLQTLLPSGNVMPWIYTAKQELCQILGPTYNTFLDEEDKQFLLYLFARSEVKGNVSLGTTATSSAPSAPEQQVRRMREALALCQASIEPLSEETWALVPLEEVRRGGSVHLHYRKTNIYDLPFETLSERYPKLAVEAVSKTHRLYSGWKQVQEETTAKTVVTSSSPGKKPLSLTKDKERSSANRQTTRPRSLREVMKSPTNLEYFRRYLKANDAYGALLFYRNVEKLRNSGSLFQTTKINRIVNQFLRRPDAKDYLQCQASLLSQIPKMRSVSPDIIFAAQDLVIKSLEATWFRKYQDSLAPCTNVVDTRTIILTGKLKNVWGIFSKFIKSICKFRSAMKDVLTRSKFEAYLRNNWHDYSLKPTVKLMGSREIESVAKCSGDEDLQHLKRRVINHKLITVEFLVNDLSFYLETESFRNMADSGTMMASAGMYGQHDSALLHHKAEMIIKLFLNSEISPKLRINIEESARDSIQQTFSLGQVDRGLFHKAIMAIFPNLIFCWKKFCSQKIKKVLVSKKEASTALPDFLIPINSDWYQNVQMTTSKEDDYTTLRFTLRYGLTLIIPQTRRDVNCETLTFPIPALTYASVLRPAQGPMGRQRPEVPPLELSSQRQKGF
ncbi:regulator of G-protein signaling protein-like isoform X1 [Esox lucius]|uniref:regulator of G-protein signaling protein-like isoform X1 n=1 Tax=Esox lucius TaxID=8010 RepID=UPI0014769D69|nr:regulator of G-protein signaling protein-like isoform X1 [Esox lucius]